MMGLCSRTIIATGGPQADNPKHSMFRIIYSPSLESSTGDLLVIEVNCFSSILLFSDFESLLKSFGLVF